MVESVIADLSKQQEGQFHVVRLSGFIHTDDKLALREIWRQLGKEMEVEEDVVNKARPPKLWVIEINNTASHRPQTTPTQWRLYLLCYHTLPR